MSPQRLCAIFTIGLLGFTAACGGTKSPAGPSTPGATPSPGGGSLGGATITGLVNSGFGTSSWRPSGAAVTVSVAGTSISTPVDGGGSFVLHGVPTGTVRLQFSGNGTNASLQLDDVADHEDIHITVNLHGSTADIDDNDREAGNRVEIEGRITSIDAGNRIVHVAGKDVTIPPGTPIVHGGTALAFSDLHVNDRIHAHATKNGTQILASKVEVQTSNGAPGMPPSPGDDHGGDGQGSEVELKGALSGLTGKCPSLSFTVSSTKVTTNQSTKFDDGCATLANDVVVEIKGTRQPDSSVLASRVEKDQ